MKIMELFFIAILPPKKIIDDISGIKKFVAKHYFSQSALKSPPHITIIPPFRNTVETINNCIEKLKMTLCKIESFNIELLDYSHFSDKVIYIHVEKNKNLLELKQKIVAEINKFEINFYNNFSPHITIANRDLTCANFKMAWSFFSSQTYSAQFYADSICVLKHNGKKWDVYNKINFKE